VARPTGQQQQKEKTKPTFDFIVGGFPKCGTTTLLKAFEAHPETAMASAEQCAVAAPALADPVVLARLDATLDSVNPIPDDDDDTTVKRSFKCPTAMYTYKVRVAVGCLVAFW
jgi:hypothetical protein